MTNGTLRRTGFGAEIWELNGEYHRNDGPAVIYSDGYVAWYQHGLLHRVDGPAIVGPDDTKLWFRHGELHREDGPAIIYPDGNVVWYACDTRYCNLADYIVAINGTIGQLVEFQMKYGE